MLETTLILFRAAIGHFSRPAPPQSQRRPASLSRPLKTACTVSNLPPASESSIASKALLTIPILAGLAPSGAVSVHLHQNSGNASVLPVQAFHSDILDQRGPHLRRQDTRLACIPSMITPACARIVLFSGTQGRCAHPLCWFSSRQRGSCSLSSRSHTDCFEPDLSPSVSFRESCFESS